MAQIKIAAIGRLASATLLGEIVKRLRRLGHHVDFYEDAHAFHQARNGMSDADVVVAAPSFTCTRSLMSSAPKLRGLVSPITGIEGFDVKAATDLGVLVANGQVRENVDGMAEATILLVLAALYDLHGTEAVLRQMLPRPQVMSARMLSGKRGCPVQC